MKTRNQCKSCGGTGRIRIPATGHFSFMRLSDGLSSSGRRRFTRRTGPTVIACPECREGKY